MLQDMLDSYWQSTVRRAFVTRKKRNGKKKNGKEDISLFETKDRLYDLPAERGPAYQQDGLIRMFVRKGKDGVLMLVEVFSKLLVVFERELQYACPTNQHGETFTRVKVSVPARRKGLMMAAQSILLEELYRVLTSVKFMLSICSSPALPAS